VHKEDDKDPNYLYCTYCTDPNKKPYGSNIATNMKNHLARAHEIVVEKATRKIQAAVIQQLRQLYLQAEVSGQTNEINI
jgi:hypothetical protein